MQQTSLLTQPIECFTPCVNSIHSHPQSVESILKSAAKTFPNTPSIFRRKREVQTPEPAISNARTDEEKIPDDLSTPVERERTARSGRQSKLHRLKSPCNGNGGDGLYQWKDYDFSPPYRLSSKRTRLFKSVEKQLEFTLEEDDFNVNKKHESLALKGKPDGTYSNVEHTRVDGENQ
ncbi:hypothetical protein QJS10_CPA07g00195 [Acorus calamus]|uniref:Uncharacterized protein n=1 Tax=Acorus calamus TaxID=4465 RepID=A0AAV9EFS1_ACOCL|nr:hypothetical protein QJS10_CPA07g00195 [Acorus calamus]